MKTSPKIIDLPELVVWKIAEHLSFEDIQNLRVTCKLLKRIMDQRTNTSLYLFVEAYPYERRLFHTNELVNYANSFHVSDLGILNRLKFKNRFSGLLKLTICELLLPWKVSCDFDLSDLNFLERLVHLEIKTNASLKEKLSLKNLKIVSFDKFSRTRFVSGGWRFELDCPQLKVLGLGTQKKPSPTAETSNSIEHLCVKAPNISELYLAGLYSKFKKLTIISFSYGANLDKFMMRVTKGRVQLPALKRIHLTEVTFFPNQLLRNLIDFKTGPETMHIEIQINWRVMNEDELLQMLNLFNEITPPEHAGQPLLFGDPSEHLLQHFNANSNLEYLLPSVRNLTLWSNKSVTLSNQLIEKLNNLKSLTFGNLINKKLNKNFFEGLLKSCREIETLVIECSGLEQEQFDLIPDYLANLQFLIFKGNFSLDNLELSFVTKLKNLCQIYFNFNIKRETMSFLLKNCKYQRDFHLEFSSLQTIRIFGHQCKVIHYLGQDYEFHIKKLKNFRDIDDAIDYYYRKDLFNTIQNFRIVTDSAKCCPPS